MSANIDMLFNPSFRPFYVTSTNVVLPVITVTSEIFIKVISTTSEIISKLVIVCVTLAVMLFKKIAQGLIDLISIVYDKSIYFSYSV